MALFFAVVALFMISRVFSMASYSGAFFAMPPSGALVRSEREREKERKRERERDKG